MGVVKPAIADIKATTLPVLKYSQPKAIVPSIGGSVNTNGAATINGSVTYFPDPFKQDTQITGTARVSPKGLDSLGVDIKNVGTPYNKNGKVKQGQLLHEIGGGVSYERDASRATTTRTTTPGTTNAAGGDFNPSGNTTRETSTETKSGIVGNVYAGGYIPLSATDPNTSVGARFGVAKDLTSSAAANPYAELNASMGGLLGKNNVTSGYLRQNFSGGGTEAGIQTRFDF